jgi:2-amino-4-hydroxy-6-hydroxymethyldihydropteridine diphosphokinase
MTRCLIALGSNLGDRTAMLDGALEEFARLKGVSLENQSAWQLTLPVGGRSGQREFLNGAALIETPVEPLDLLATLQQVENRFGRVRGERWGNRTLDVDLLLYGESVIDLPQLTVPHPRMSFRRFVLDPAVEIAGEMLHPTIGWTLGQLLDHLDMGAECVAVVSQDKSAREAIAAALMASYELIPSEATVEDELLWPEGDTTWLRLANEEPVRGHPKLTILFGTGVDRMPGRGPTLELASLPTEDVEQEVFAAVEAVWPRLGRSPD